MGEYSISQSYVHKQYSISTTPMTYYLAAPGQATCVHNIEEVYSSSRGIISSQSLDSNNSDQRTSLSSSEYTTSNSEVRKKIFNKGIRKTISFPGHYKTRQHRYWKKINRLRKNQTSKRNYELRLAEDIDKKVFSLQNHIRCYKDVHEKLRILLKEYSAKISEVQRFPKDMRKLEKHWECLSRTLKEQKTTIANLENALSLKTKAFDHASASLGRSEATSAYRKAAMTNMKNELAETLAQKKRLEEELEEAQNTNKRLNSQSKNLSSQIETVSQKLQDLKDVNTKLEENFRAQLKCYELEKNSCHEECKAKTHETLVRMSGVYQRHLTDLSNRQALSDFKIRELYLTLENVVKGLYISNGNESIICNENKVLECGENIKSPVETPQLLNWLQCCNKMVFKTKFADELSNFILNICLPKKYDALTE